MTNIAEILKNAPELKLYSLVHGYVTLEKVNINHPIYPIIVIDCDEDDITFTKDGKLINNIENAECVLFPSKEHKSWENWQEVLFQRGDVITISGDKLLLYNNTDHAFTNKALSTVITANRYRYATPEEREQFFKELNDNGYYWNENTKQMEKSLQQDKHKNCLGCIATETKKEPFTIDDFKPFDKVLVKYDFDTKWTIELFEQYDKSQKDTGEYICLASSSNYCIPYNDETKHLLGTTDDAPDKYKTW